MSTESKTEKSQEKDIKEKPARKQKEPARILLGAAIALILAAIAATFAITMSFAKSLYGDLIPSLSPRAAMYSAIQELDAVVRNNFYGEIDNISHTAQLEIGYIKGIGDSKSRYLSPSEYSAYQQRLRGNEPGAGMQLYLDTASGKLLVTRVFAKSPAAKSGLKAGDVLTEIAGTRVNMINATGIMDKLQGSTLSSVKLKYSRDGKETAVSVMLGYSSPTIVYDVYDGVGYIRVFAFYEKTAGEIDDAIEDLQKKKVEELVFDLRGVSEGSIEHAASALNNICPVSSDYTNALATLIDKDGKVKKSFPSDATKQVQMEMAVIINAKTSGSAELFACVLKDFGKARWLVGEKSAGEDTAQELFQLKNGGGILLTVAKVRPYRTESYDEGLEPDIPAALTDENKKKGALLPVEEDAQAQAAFNLFKQGQETGAQPSPDDGE